MTYSHPVKMGKISYINAFPVYYGLDHGLCPEWLEMIPDVPAVLNQKIMSGQIDISPISAAFYAMNHKELLILPDLSISSHKDVLSVLLAAKKPMAQMDGKKILLSKESATAASLVKMIFSQQKIRPVFETASVRHISDLPEYVDAVLVIGDTALTQPWSEHFPHVIDLGRLWYDMTGLPFVFAVWVVRKAFARKWPQQVHQVHQTLIKSRKMGEDHIESVIKKGIDALSLSPDRIRHYFDLLYCDLDEPKIRAMDTFFSGLFEQKILKDKVTIRQFDPTQPWI